MADIPTTRQALRSELQARRAAATPAQRITAAQGLRGTLEQIPEFLTDANIGGYWATSGELPLMALFDGMRQRDQIFHLPVVGPLHSLQFVAWKVGDEVAPNRYGIPEPVHERSRRVAVDMIDVLLMPLLGFDRSGNRLGFGGGYYDRALEFLRDREQAASTLLVGVGYSFQEVEHIDAEPWDVKFDYIATERELISCWPDKS
ncbi:MAG: 5-formyltetrahydrofolate cyclo-ligase [Dokdonella sp.]